MIRPKSAGAGSGEDRMPSTEPRP